MRRLSFYQPGHLYSSARTRSCHGGRRHAQPQRRNPLTLHTRCLLRPGAAGGAHRAAAAAAAAARGLPHARRLADAHHVPPRAVRVPLLRRLLGAAHRGRAAHGCGPEALHQAACVEGLQGSCLRRHQKWAQGFSVEGLTQPSVSCNAASLAAYSFATKPTSRE
jgi:hypothetical protein